MYKPAEAERKIPKMSRRIDWPVSSVEIR